MLAGLLAQTLTHFLVVSFVNALAHSINQAQTRSYLIYSLRAFSCLLPLLSPQSISSWNVFLCMCVCARRNSLLLWQIYATTTMCLCLWCLLISVYATMSMCCSIVLFRRTFRRWWGPLVTNYVNLSLARF